MLDIYGIYRLWVERILNYVNSRHQSQYHSTINFKESCVTDEDFVPGCNVCENGQEILMVNTENFELIAEQNNAADDTWGMSEMYVYIWNKLDQQEFKHMWGSKT